MTKERNGRDDNSCAWFLPLKNELLSKPQYNSVDVRKQLISAAKIIESFESPMISIYFFCVNTHF